MSPFSGANGPPPSMHPFCSHRGAPDSEPISGNLTDYLSEAIDTAHTPNFITRNTIGRRFRVNRAKAGLPFLRPNVAAEQQWQKGDKL
jgi:hypothetical protein